MAGLINLGLTRISSELRQAGLNAQFVYDWQVGPAEGYDDFGSALVYAPGTFVRLDGPTLDLGVVRDSTLNAANDFQSLFRELDWTGNAGYRSDLCPGNRSLPDWSDRLGFSGYLRRLVTELASRWRDKQPALSGAETANGPSRDGGSVLL